MKTDSCYDRCFKMAIKTAVKMAVKTSLSNPTTSSQLAYWIGHHTKGTQLTREWKFSGAWIRRGVWCK